MADLQQTKLKFHQDIAAAEHHIDQVTATDGMSAQLFRNLQRLLEAAFAYTTSATQGLVILEHQYSVEFPADELAKLKTMKSEVTTKYGNARANLYQLEPNQTLDQPAQVSRILDVTDQSSVQDRKREDAGHQTKLKMDLLEIDLEVSSRQSRSMPAAPLWKTTW